MKINHKLTRYLLARYAERLRKKKQKRQKDLLLLTNLIQKFTKKQFGSAVFHAAKELIADENGKWMNFVDQLFKELHPNVIKMHTLNLGYEALLLGTKKIRYHSKKYNCNVPWLILMDPTSTCNLKCYGCWAAQYGNKLNLSYEDLDKIILQGKALGIHFYMYTGGEPLVRKADIIKLCDKHKDCAFHAFTNGTLIDDAFCREMKRVGNLSLSLSVEGFEAENDNRRGIGTYERVMNAMDTLKKHRQLYGVSVCYTSKNIEAVTSDDFLDLMIEKGCRFAWYFHYMPVGKDADIELLPNKEQREYMYHRIREIRAFEGGKPIFAMDFQNDGEFVGGCIAAGRSYLHINANGDVEPCVFIHYSQANIKEVTLLEALQQPLFKIYHENRPFNKNHLRPCPMLENPEILQKIVAASGAKSTDLQSPEPVEVLCGKCSAYAEAWKDKAEELWNK